MKIIHLIKTSLQRFGSQAQDLGEAGIGDRVEIMETRKISKDVNWRLVKIIEKAK